MIVHASRMPLGSLRTAARTLSTKARIIPGPPTGTMTKIVCTLGPSTDTLEPISRLVAEGMHVARLNFSHAGVDYSYPEKLMELVRSVPGKHHQLMTGALKASMPPNLRAILVDTKGPEIRTGPLQGGVGEALFETGCEVEVTIHDVSNDPAPSSANGPHRLQVDYQSIAKTVQVGGQILLDDGLLALEVLEIDPKEEYVKCKALNAGPIKKNKGVNLPNAQLDLPALTDKDKRDLKWACENGADFVAASFIRTPENVRSVIAYLDRCVAALPDRPGGNRPIRPLVISKIESKEGVDNFEEILEESDGIMVARGDLGVEIPFHQVFKQQKRMVAACNSVGKPVIVATQMLDSMQRNPRPTRAEVTDVGTGVLDGASSVMLSGETAAGRYPIESLKAMVSVVTEADDLVDTKGLVVEERERALGPMDMELDAICAASVQGAKDMNAKMIVLVTMTGKSARVMALHRPSVPVLAFCTDRQVGRRLQLHRAITPIMLQPGLDPRTDSMSKIRAEAVRTAKELGFLKAGDRIIMMDRKPGKSFEMHQYAHNMTLCTIREN